jgi:hypothetical protein
MALYQFANTNTQQRPDEDVCMDDDALTSHGAPCASA